MNSRLTFLRRLSVALSAAALFGLAACGGGGGAPTSTGVDGMAVSGTITGFGSVIIDGVRFDDSSATVSIDTDPASPTDGTLADLKLGMQVEARVVDGKLAGVVVHPALVGPIGGVDVAGSSFTVYGQTVSVVIDGATPTVFEGTTGLAGLAPGDVVEVHGTLDGGRVLVATRVERRPGAEPASGVRIGGVIAALDASARTFRINDMTVDYSAAAVLPEGSTPHDGQLVVAVSDSAPGAAGFKAKAIKLVTTADGEAFGVGGRIMAFNSVADFTVSGVRIDASAATFDNGTAGDLGVGVIVGAEGTVSGGVLKAAKVRVLKTPIDVNASLKGEIGDWVSVSSFKVRGTPVDASAAVFVGGTAADLGNGARVMVIGHVAGNALKADKVEFLAPPTAQVVTLSGEIRDYDAAHAEFHFLGVTLKLGDGVAFVGGGVGDLANGKRVEVTGTPRTEGVVTLSKVVFLGDLPPQATVVGGRLFDLGESGFKLPGVAVTLSADTSFDGGSRADLANGVLVLVKGRYDPATKAVIAAWIEIVKEDAGLPRVAGTVGDFHSQADFHVGPQAVDATGAAFVDGSAADLANGVLVEVVGTLEEAAAGKVLVASQLRFLVK